MPFDWPILKMGTVPELLVMLPTMKMISPALSFFFRDIPTVPCPEIKIKNMGQPRGNALNWPISMLSVMPGVINFTVKALLTSANAVLPECMHSSAARHSSNLHALIFFIQAPQETLVSLIKGPQNKLIVSCSAAPHHEFNSGKMLLLNLYGYGAHSFVIRNHSGIG